MHIHDIKTRLRGYDGIGNFHIHAKKLRKRCMFLLYTYISHSQRVSMISEDGYVN